MLNYEINAYIKGTQEQENIPIGTGKRAKNKAIKQANKMWNTGKYEAVFVDCNNGEEIVDNECINIPTK